MSPFLEYDLQLDYKIDNKYIFQYDGILPPHLRINHFDLVHGYYLSYCIYKADKLFHSYLQAYELLNSLQLHFCQYSTLTTGRNLVTVIVDTLD